MEIIHDYLPEGAEPLYSMEKNLKIYFATPNGIEEGMADSAENFLAPLFPEREWNRVRLDPVQELKKHECFQCCVIEKDPKFFHSISEKELGYFGVVQL